MKEQRTQLQWLIDDYLRLRALPDALNQRDLAAREAKMWDLVPHEERTRLPYNQIREWAKRALGEGGHDYMLRNYLHRAEGSDPLFRRVDDKRLTLSKAVSLHRDAKHRALAEKTTVTEALADILREYEQLPIVRLENGYAIRGRKPSDLTPPRKARRGANGKASSPKTAEDPKTFFTAMRELISTYASSRLEGLSPDVVRQRIVELEAEVNETLDVWSDRLNRDNQAASRRAGQQATFDKAEATIKRRAFLDACHVLRMSAPKPGAPVDLKAAKAQKRKLARAYHPDMHGTAETREAYEAVLDAFRTVQKYHDETNKSADRE